MRERGDWWRAGRGLLAGAVVLVLQGLTGIAGTKNVYAGTLADVKARGYLKCGVSQGLPGFSNIDGKGNWSGIDVDVCRGVAAAVFGDAGKVKYTPLSSKERFTALQSGEVDMLSRNTTWTMGRDTALGIHFAGVTYYDGQGFIVRKEAGVKSVLELDGATVCTNTGTTTEQNIADYFTQHKMKYQILVYEKADEVVRAYDEERCDAYTTDRSALAAQRLKFSNPAAHVVLPEIISKEPLGPAVRQGDDGWFNLVKWTLFAMINAEEMGVNSKNLDAKMKSTDPAMKRLLGLEGDFGRRMGVARDWAVQIIRHVGNYGEIYERNVGEKTPLKLKRGINQLWTRGGIMYAPPIR